VGGEILWENSQKLYKVTEPSAADDAKRAASVGISFAAG